MKLIGIVAVIGLLVIIAAQVYAKKSSNNIETYNYKVVKKYADFEIRKYEASLFTSVQLKANRYEEASSEGFSVLAGYIFGGNERKEQIAMTSPVAMSIEDTMTMMFLVPKAYNKENLPKPNQGDIEFTEMPSKTVAAITFGGWASTERIKEYKSKLTAALDAQGIAYSTKFFFLGYNPPFEMVGRRNEVIVELE